jgi:hypothetical protein
VNVPSVTTQTITTPPIEVPAQIATPEVAGAVPPVTVDLRGTPRITIGSRSD